MKRFVVQYKNRSTPEWTNLFIDNRSFASVYYAQYIADRYHHYSECELQIKSIDVITDAERLELLAERGWGVCKNELGSIDDHFFVFDKYGKSLVYRNTFREAIDASMKMKEKI